MEIQVQEWTDQTLLLIFIGMAFIIPAIVLYLDDGKVHGK
jgi:hypothetical protein